VRLGRNIKTVNGTYPPSAGAKKILSDIGFFKALKLRDPLEQKDLDEVRSLHIGLQSFVKTNAAEILRFKDTFIAAFPHFTNQEKQRMQAAIVEAILNCFEHAFGARGDFTTLGRRAWLSGYVNTEKNEFMMMVFDHGAGIPRTLKANFADFLTSLARGNVTPSESQIVRAATQLYRTSTDQPGRGRGFQSMKAFIDLCEDGELRVLSNRGVYIYAHSGERTLPDQAESLGGTLVQWRIRQRDNAQAL
jgi:hypothetical protein